jgi:aminopeptidase YwaD
MNRWRVIPLLALFLVGCDAAAQRPPLSAAQKPPLSSGAQKLPLSPAAEEPPLLAEKEVAALAEELSGETAKKNLEGVSRLHRMRGSRPFRAAAELLVERAKAYGLEDVKIEEFPADGKIVYGTQRSRPAWDAEFAELWEMKQKSGQWVPAVRWGDWDAQPLTLAQDSESADVTAELLDVGDGTAESDYAGKDVKGKIVLVTAQPGAVERLAVGKHGAAGIVSAAQNQRTAWWGDDQNLIRWGHLNTFGGVKTFGFMVSLKTARGFRERLGRGEKIILHATVKAGQHPGAYSIPTAAILGADPRLREEEIVFSCHLDHPRPGANDNASGCVTILEVGRTLSTLIARGLLARPARTLRFVWPPEVEGTVVLLNAKPGWAKRIKAVVHMDMVGGGPETKAVFHVTRGPTSLPSFIYDVGQAFGEFVNEQSYEYAARGRAAYPLVASEGGKEPLLAQMSEFSSGSDHAVYVDGSFRIPAIYLNDWPDRYIHTNLDVAANIDATKLKRAGFIGAASGYFLAKLSAQDEKPVLQVIEAQRLMRLGKVLSRTATLAGAESANTLREAFATEAATIRSLDRFFSESREIQRSLQKLPELAAILGASGQGSAAEGDGKLKFLRNAQVKGPMGVFGYDYFEDKYGEEQTQKLKLLSHESSRASGDGYAYEVLNFADGARNAQQIRDAVSAEYGPVPLEYVLEYLRAAESIGVVQPVK